MGPLRGLVRLTHVAGQVRSAGAHMYVNGADLGAEGPAGPWNNRSLETYNDSQGT